MRAVIYGGWLRREKDLTLVQKSCSTTSPVSRPVSIHPSSKPDLFHKPTSKPHHLFPYPYPYPYPPYPILHRQLQNMLYILSYSPLHGGNNSVICSLFFLSGGGLVYSCQVSFRRERERERWRKRCVLVFGF